MLLLIGTNYSDFIDNWQSDSEMKISVESLKISLIIIGKKLIRRYKCSMLNSYIDGTQL